MNFHFRFKLCDHRRPIKLTVSSWTLFSSIKQNKIPSFEGLKISIIDAFNNKQTLKLSKFQSSSSFNQYPKFANFSHKKFNVFEGFKDDIFFLNVIKFNVLNMVYRALKLICCYSRARSQIWQHHLSGWVHVLPRKFSELSDLDIGGSAPEFLLLESDQSKYKGKKE